MTTQTDGATVEPCGDGAAAEVRGRTDSALAVEALAGRLVLAAGALTRLALIAGVRATLSVVTVHAVDAGSVLAVLSLVMLTARHSGPSARLVRLTVRLSWPIVRLVRLTARLSGPSCSLSIERVETQLTGTMCALAMEALARVALATGALAVLALAIEALAELVLPAALEAALDELYGLMA